MSSLGGPSIVTSGLVLHLDAGNIKSYPGEETVNFITNPIPTSTSNFVVQGGIGTSTYDSTINAVRWVRTSYETWGAFYHNSSLANYLFDTTATYSISFKWKYGPSHSATYSTYFNIIQDNGQNTIMGNYVLTTYSTLLSDGWYYFKTSGIPANPGITQTGLAPGFRIITGSQSGITDIYWKNLQFEKKTYSTPFVNGTRGTTVETSGGWIDRSGNSNSGQILNGPTYNSLKGGSISFDGVNDYLPVPTLANTAFPQSTGTIAIWYNIDSTGATSSLPPIFDNFDGVRNHIFIRRYNNQLLATIQIGFQYIPYNGLSYVYVYNPTFTLDTWHNIVVTYVTGVSSSVKVYIDGALANSGTISDSAWIPSGQFVGFGASTTNTAKGKGGIIQVYNRALSSTEVLQNYNATKSRFI